MRVGVEFEESEVEFGDGVVDGGDGDDEAGDEVDDWDKRRLASGLMNLDIVVFYGVMGVYNGRPRWVFKDPVLLFRC